MALIACLDVDYRASGACAACVLLDDWTNTAPKQEIVSHIAQVEPYVPGKFYLRELPCLLAVLAEVHHPLQCIVIDGYVWLDQHNRTGLGARLYDAIDRAVPVIGVAKTAFAGSDFALPVLRSGCHRPLFITSAGMDAAIAASHIQHMPGQYRVPAMLKRVDQLCRTA